MDSQRLADMVAKINERNMAIDSFLIVRNGYLVSENYFRGWKQDMVHETQSAGRSVTSVLVGIALDKGYIKALDQKVLSFFPRRAFANMDERKEAMTLEDVLTMREGLEWEETDQNRLALQGSKDWLQWIMDRPMASQPGTRWLYCSVCSHILTVVLNETTGTNPRDFAEQYLFGPLGIRGVKWMADPAGIPNGAGGFGLTPRDMAKLGYLFLRKGQWDGQQVVSADWVKRSTQKYAEVDQHFGYGYHWFTVKSMGGYPGYAAVGGGGQIIAVVPDLDLVIVTTAKTDESIFELMEQYVLPAIQK